MSKSVSRKDLSANDKNLSSKTVETELIPKRSVPPDGGWGWMVLFGTMLMNIVVIGHGKSFGVYFRTLMEEFDASPSRVAWLLSLQISTFGFLSPVGSLLAQSFGPRKVALAGGLLAFVGLTVSSFATSLAQLYIFYGFVQGLAVTMTFTPGISMIAKYFHHRRGLANGLTMAGNAVGGIIMPLIANKLISEYSIKGCFLIMGSILLHACVGAMLWQPVEWHQTKSMETTSILDEDHQAKSIHSGNSLTDKNLLQMVDNQETNISKDLCNEKELIMDCNRETRSDSSNDSNVLKSSVPEVFIHCRDSITYDSVPDLYYTGKYVANNNIKIIKGESSPHLTEVSNERTCWSSVSSESLPNMFRFGPSFLKHRSRNSFIYWSSYSFGPVVGAVLTKDILTAQGKSESNSVYNDLSDTKNCKKWKLASCFQKVSIDKSIFENSRFYVMTISLFFHVLGYQGTMTFLPYRATTLGLSKSHAASLLSVLAFTDVIGRISCAWISDFDIFPRKYWYIGGMFTSGICAICLPFYKSYATLIFGAASFGFCCGAYIGLVVVMFADAYSADKVALAYSISTVSGGFMALGGPPLIGYVLESTGSYTICQLILGTAQFAGSAVWLAEPWAQRVEKRRQENKLAKTTEKQQLV